MAVAHCCGYRKPERLHELGLPCSFCLRKLAPELGIFGCCHPVPFWPEPPSGVWLWQQTGWYCAMGHAGALLSGADGDAGTMALTAWLLCRMVIGAATALVAAAAWRCCKPAFAQHLPDV